MTPDRRDALRRARDRLEGLPVTGMKPVRVDRRAEAVLLACSFGGVPAIARVFLGDTVPILAPRLLPEDYHRSPRAVRTDAVVAAEVAALAHAAAATDRLSVPGVLASGPHFMVMERFPGFSLRERPVSAAFERAGAWLRRLHDSRGTSMVVVDLHAAALGVEELGAHAPRYLGSVIARAAATFRDSGLGTVPTTAGLTHGDFTLANIMWDPVTNRLGVVDFEHAGPRPQLHDLVAMIGNIRAARWEAGASDRRAAESDFWAGYGPTDEQRALVDVLVAAWVDVVLALRAPGLRWRVRRATRVARSLVR